MITELCIFDFDATLFMSPMFPDDWEGHTGDWFDTLQSLTPPCVVLLCGIVAALLTWQLDQPSEIHIPFLIHRILILLCV